MEWIFEKAGCKLVVLHQSETTDFTEELSQDLISIVTVFVARHNGLRAAQYQRERQEKTTEKVEEGKRRSETQEKEAKRGKTPGRKNDQNTITTQ